MSSTDDDCAPSSVLLSSLDGDCKDDGGKIDVTLELEEDVDDAESPPSMADPMVPPVV